MSPSPNAPTPQPSLRKARLRIDALTTRAGVALADALSGRGASLGQLQKLADDLAAASEAIGAASTQEEAVRRHLSRELSFASGAAHGASATIRAFAHSAQEADRISAEPGQSRPERVCEALSGSLAALDLDEAWSIVVLAKRRAAAADGLSNTAYSEGVSLALQQLTVAFRAHLEQRVTSLLRRDDLDNDQRRLAVLLFVAITRPTRQRVLSVLGSEFETIFTTLDDEDSITCAKAGEDPPRRVSAKGSKEARRLLEVA